MCNDKHFKLPVTCSACWNKVPSWPEDLQEHSLVKLIALNWKQAHPSLPTGEDTPAAVKSCPACGEALEILDIRGGWLR